MTNIKNTVICLHLNDGTYLVGYLVSESAEKIIIAQSIRTSSGVPCDELAIDRSHIRQCYTLPVTWW